MSSLDIGPVDPFDDAALAAWHHVYDLAERFGNEDVATVWQLEEVRVPLQEPDSRAFVGAWSGRLAGEVVAAGWMRLPLVDNLGLAELAVHVLPDRRRRGFGRAMAEQLEREARDRGRTILAGEVRWGATDDVAGHGVPGAELARALGFTLALGDVQREVRLPVPDEVLAGLADDVAPHHAAYTLRSFVGPVPDDLVAGWATLSASLSTEAPTGERDLEPEVITVEAHREAEEVLLRQGRTKYNTVALDQAGTVVAFTDIATTVHEPGRAYQWGTLVHRDHRGHRLGLAVKVANLRLLQRERPDIERLITWNAESNSHMVAVNERMGFRAVGRLGEFQKRLA